MGLDRSKVRKINDGEESYRGDVQRLLADARAVFIEWADNALKEASGQVDDLAGPEFAAARDAIFGVFHDVKGAGGGVGLDLMSDIGASGCDFLRELDAPSRKAAKVVKAHIVTAQGVLAAGIDGDGGAAGQALAEKLRGYTLDS